MFNRSKGKRLKHTAPNYARRFALAAAVLLAVLYAWQVASVWAAQQSLADLYDLGLGTRGLLSGRAPQTLLFSGRGIASGATGTLRYNTRGFTAVLRLQDLPVLPGSLVYQLWCIDYDGRIDAASSFNVPADSNEAVAIGVGTPRMVIAYTRFIITVESSSNSRSPSSQVVMASEPSGPQ